MLELPVNKDEPKVLWLDRNSAFAMAEQQANPHLRGRPVGVAAYTTDNGCVVSPSPEAKRAGCKVGMPVRECRKLCPSIAILAPDPPKYRWMHLQIKDILSRYTPDLCAKSIDEFALNLARCPEYARGMETVGSEIKERHRTLYNYATVNIGIGPNRFLAKTAASLHKPDGLDRVDWRNLEETYSRLELTDLCGINTRYQARLNAYGIRTPLEFLAASEVMLRTQVFKSIHGTHWYRRLRGYEVDDIEWDVKSFGKMYSLPCATEDDAEIAKLLMKMCTLMGARLRRAGFLAKGVHIGITFKGYAYWHTERETGSPLYSDIDLYTKILWLYNMRPRREPIIKLSVSCFHLAVSSVEQLNLFEQGRSKNWLAADAMDRINATFGDLTIFSAAMAGMEELVIDRISFGAIRELEEMYA